MPPKERECQRPVSSERHARPLCFSASRPNLFTPHQLPARLRPNHHLRNKLRKRRLIQRSVQTIQRPRHHRRSLRHIRRNGDRVRDILIDIRER